MTRSIKNVVLAVLLAGGTLHCGGEDGGGEEAGTGTVKVTIGGEDLAAAGIPFDPTTDPHLADGWSIAFDHALVVVDAITLSENPDFSPTDQSQKGKVVAELDGPFAVDIHAKGPLPGEGGEGSGTAWPIGDFEDQNKNGGAPFSADERYAFSYKTVRATAKAKKVNFEGDGAVEDLYEKMVQNGWSVLLTGTATFEGGDACETSDANYPFGEIPKKVRFELGFGTPVSAINCDNELNQGEPFEGEEFQRGIPIFANKASIAQMMFHMDHPVFSDVVHEPALYFTQIAAQAIGQGATPTVTMDDLADLDPTAFVDSMGRKLPWRICDGTSLPLTDQMSFGVGTIAVNPSGSPSSSFRDYRDFLAYVQSTQTHLNGGEGLCYVQRNYPSPR